MMTRLAFAILCLAALTGQRAPVLVPEVSQDEVQLRQGFVGTELLLFGAVLERGGRRAGGYEIAVILKGPAEAVRLREKEQRAGIWMNAADTDFRSVPSYFALASSAPVGQLVDERTAAIYELGLDYIQLSPSGAIDPVEQARFRAGLVDLRRRQGLYRQDGNGVTISEGVLYQARIPLPANVRPGTYTAETFAIADGRVLSSAVAQVEVRKVGFERLVEVAALERPLWYGLAAILLSVGMGWAAGRLFARR